MLDREQADVAADALLEEHRRVQAAKTAALTALAARRRQPFPPVKWTVICSLAGLVIGSVAEYALSGNITFWGIAGVGIGAAVGIPLDARHRT